MVNIAFEDIANIKYTTHYSPTTDTTFITRDKYNGQGDCLESEIISFYHGEPEDDATIYFVEHASIIAQYPL